MSVDTNALRRGFGSAAGASQRICAYHQACVKAADEIDCLAAKLAESEESRNYFANQVDTTIEDMGSRLDEATVRIFELEDAARYAREALKYHVDQTRPILMSSEAIEKLNEVLK
jgi:hypothetical protein